MKDSYKSPIDLLFDEIDSPRICGKGEYGFLKNGTIDEKIHNRILEYSDAIQILLKEAIKKGEKQSYKEKE